MRRPLIRIRCLNLTNLRTSIYQAKARHILDHVITLHAKQFTPVDKGLIRPGELKNVAGTPWISITRPRLESASMKADEQLLFGKGYDLTGCSLGAGGSGLSLAAEAYDPKSGRKLEVLTTEPGVQFYSGNFWTAQKARETSHIHNGAALCLETQHFPDSPNHPTSPAPC